MEKKELHFSGRGILTVIGGIVVMSASLASLSTYLLDLIML